MTTVPKSQSLKTQETIPTLQKLSQDPNWSPTADVLELIPADFAYGNTVLPLSIVPATGLYPERLCVALNEELELISTHKLIRTLRLKTGLWIEPTYAQKEDIERAISLCYRNQYRKQNGEGNEESTYTISSSEPGESIHSLSIKNSFSQAAPSRQVSSSNTSSPIGLVNGVLEEAIRTGASDIHLEPFEEDMKIRLRHDGVLKLFRTVPLPIVPEVLSRIKVMAQMDIAEKRRPQDGRIQVMLRGNKNVSSKNAIDMRISSLPTKHGEKIVIRLLDKRAVSLELSAVGMSHKDRELFHKYIQKPHGMILVTGPTGSGKTTTLYSALNAIVSPELNISTIEDPIEYQMDGVVQTAVKPEIDLTFAHALRTLLRQDPNVIMVGEIRDEETAQMAVRASMTGHLLFSTVHTNDAPSTPGRLLDMGLEPFLIASSLSLIVAQRLVRKVCPHCTQTYVPEVDTSTVEQQIKEYGLLPKEGVVYKRGAGCIHCHQSGFIGRLGLFEILPVSEKIQELIRDRADATTIRKKAVQEGMWTLRQDGLCKVLQGSTTIEEVLRETDAGIL